jgi:signal peptidase
MTMARVLLAPTETEAHGSDRAGRALTWVGHVLAWMVIITVGAVLALTVVVPRLAGATPYTVLTGSMRPGLPPGTLVVVRPAGPDASGIGIGDVVTYQLRSGEPEVVTHRVVSVASDADGLPVFRTQGDANSIPDQDWVRAAQVRGVRWYSVPYLGYLNNLLTGKERQMAVSAVATLLLGYAAFMFGTAARSRRRGATT